MRQLLLSLKIPLAIVVGSVAFALILRTGTPRSGFQRQEASSTSSKETAATAAASDQILVGESAKVTFVVDGDTVEFENGERVRLIGIDTPERGKPVYGEARDHLTALVLGKTVRVGRDISERDRYGRLLLYLYVGETFVNLEMVTSGFARAYTYPPDVAHAKEFVAAEQEARSAARGLWGLSREPGQASKSTVTSFPTPEGGYELPVCASTDCDCADFTTHAQAQWFHDTANVGDKHRLDRDKDGRVCETLP